MAVLANPAAGRGRHDGLLPAVIDALGAAGRPVRLLDRTGPEAGEAAARAAVAEGASALVAVGGDGTVHLGLQAVAGTAVPFGAVPVGTANDFAADVGLPADPLDAARLLAGALSAGTTRPVDLAHVAGKDGYGRWYGAVLAAGFDAIVNERANAMRFPRGPRRYDIAILLELARLRPRRYALDLDGERTEVEAVMVAIGNGPCYGGGMRICPAADHTDGLLDVVIVHAISRTTFARIKPQVYAGTHVNHPAVRTYRARTVGLAAEGIRAYADGEPGCHLPIEVTAVPGALRVLTADQGQR